MDDIKHDEVEFTFTLEPSASVRFKPALVGYSVAPLFRATACSAAFDLPANEYAELEFGEVVTIGTGLKAEMHGNIYLLVLPRSGLAAKHGITVVNAPGLIDPDYKGEIKVVLTKLTPGVFSIKPGDYIAQLLVVRQAMGVEITGEVEVSMTERGAGGFGSTGGY